MSWGRDDPGFPPSPDPAAQAEEYFYQQSLMQGPDEPPWECETCRDEPYVVPQHHPHCGGFDCSRYECPIEVPEPCPACGAPPVTVHAQPSLSVPGVDIEDDEVPF